MKEISSVDDTAARVPRRVLELHPRERELAMLVYSTGGITAVELQDRLSTPLSSAAVRSMLGRLCQKGILKRRKRNQSTSCGRRIAFVYLPALTDENIREGAIQQCARDFFEGSLLLMAQTAIEVLNIRDKRYRKK